MAEKADTHGVSAFPGHMAKSQLMVHFSHLTSGLWLERWTLCPVSDHKGTVLCLLSQPRVSSRPHDGLARTQLRSLSVCVEQRSLPHQLCPVV